MSNKISNTPNPTSAAVLGIVALMLGGALDCAVAAVAADRFGGFEDSYCYGEAAGKAAPGLSKAYEALVVAQSPQATRKAALIMPAATTADALRACGIVRRVTGREAAPESALLMYRSRDGEWIYQRESEPTQRMQSGGYAPPRAIGRLEAEYEKEQQALEQIARKEAEAWKAKQAALPPSRQFIRQPDITHDKTGPGNSRNIARGWDLDACEKACLGQQTCVAYTWVKPGGYVRGDATSCYLHTALGQENRSTCCVSGVRAGAATGASAGQSGRP